VLLVSGGFTFFTERLRTRLGLDFTAANTLEIVNGELTGRVLGPIVDAQGKLDAMRRVMAELGLEKRSVIGLGDGANDLLFLQECALSVAFHAKPVVRRQTTHSLNHVGLDGVLQLFDT
jgi:phosphoserine phosphatase